jgi:hypothetical protein
MDECIFFSFKNPDILGQLIKENSSSQKKKKKKKEIGGVILTLFSSNGNPPVKIGNRKIKKLVWYSVGNN